MADGRPAVGRSHRQGTVASSARWRSALEGNAVVIFRVNVNNEFRAHEQILCISIVPTDVIKSNQIVSLFRTIRSTEHPKKDIRDRQKRNGSNSISSVKKIETRLYRKEKNRNAYEQ